MLEACKQEIIELDLQNKFYTFLEAKDTETLEMFTLCCNVNRIVFD